MRPSFLVSVLSGLIFLLAIIIFLINIRNLTDQVFRLIVLLFLIGISLGVHSINHSFEEIYFDFNPFANKWLPKDEPQK